MKRSANRANYRAAAATEAVTLPDAQADHEWGLRHDALYRCQLSTRYHRRRERFFDWMDRATSAIALIGGSAAFAAATAARLGVVQIAAIAVTSAAAISLVLGFADKARRHAALAESYKRIEAEILRAGDYDYTEQQINAWRARIAETEAGEPPALRSLIVLCQNDIAAAANQHDKVTALVWYKRWFAQMVDFEINDKGKRPRQAA